ncbi:MAG: pilus assembly FimT family protein [Janthinobacterium lividum]
MPPTSPVTSKRRGFTLIELIVVLFVLLLLTTAIVPRVVAIQRSRRTKDLEAKIIRLPAEARNEAVRSGNPVRIRVDGAALVMDRAPINGTAEEVKRIALGTGIQVNTVEEAGQPSNTGSWQWTIYPDGSADDGGIQFTEGTAQKSLVLSSDGSVRWLIGDLPAGTPERWPAGQLQQRN